MSRKFSTTTPGRSLALLAMPVLMTGVLAAGCGSNYRDVKLAVQQEQLQAECEGEFTNTCTSKNIDFDIAVLRSRSAAEALAEGGPETKRQMVALFGADRAALYEPAYDAVRERYIAMLESKRPGWFSRWFLGGQQPFNGGVKAFYFSEDLDPFKEQVNEEFARRVQATGWKPTPEQLTRHEPSPPAPAPVSGSPSDDSTVSSEASPAPVAVPDTHAQAVADAIEAAQQRQLAPPAPTVGDLSPTVEPPTGSNAFSPAWQAIRQQLKAGPNVFLGKCNAQYLKSEQEFGGIDPAHNDQVPALCRQLLADYTGCTKLDAPSSQRCFDERTQDLE